jgi:hypothetical protein
MVRLTALRAPICTRSANQPLSTKARFLMILANQSLAPITFPHPGPVVAVDSHV